MRTTRVLPLALASVLTLAATGCGSDFKKDEPQTAVRDFLSDALVNGNGQKACDYLTPRAQRILAGDPQTGQKCREAMERALLVGDEDGGPVDNTGDVEDLKYSTQTDGHKAVVTVKGKEGASLEIKLGHSEALGNLYDYDTKWRITDGVAPLIKGS